MNLKFVSPLVFLLLLLAGTGTAAAQPASSTADVLAALDGEICFPTTNLAAVLRGLPSDPPPAPSDPPSDPPAPTVDSLILWQEDGHFWTSKPGDEVFDITVPVETPFRGGIVFEVDVRIPKWTRKPGPKPGDKPVPAKGGAFQVQVGKWNGGLLAYNALGAKGYLFKSDWAQPTPKDDRKKEGRLPGVRVGGTYRVGFVLESGEESSTVHLMLDGQVVDSMEDLGPFSLQVGDKIEIYLGSEAAPRSQPKAPEGSTGDAGWTWANAVLRLTPAAEGADSAVFDPDAALRSLRKRVSGSVNGVADFVQEFSWSRFVNRGPYTIGPGPSRPGERLTADQKAQKVEQHLRASGGGSGWYLKAIAELQSPQTFTAAQVDDFLNTEDGIKRGSRPPWGEAYRWPAVDETRQPDRLEARDLVRRVLAGPPRWEVLVGHPEVGVLLGEVVEGTGTVVTWADIVHQLAALSDQNDSRVRAHLPFWGRLAR